MAIIHFNGQQVDQDEIIQPGNFGRLLRRLHPSIVGNNHRVQVSGMVAREYLFELIRRDLIPSAPSRLNCVFACPTDDDAKLYGNKNNKDGHMRMYEVEPVSPELETHTAWISHCTMTAPAESFIDLMEPRGRAYWNGDEGDPIDGQEVLFQCPLRVVKVL